MLDVGMRLSPDVFARAAPATPAPQAAPAQQQPAPSAGHPAAGPGADQPDTGTPIIRTTVNEVNLIFTVTDRHGHYIPNLKQSDFALLDDQKAP